MSANQHVTITITIPSDDIFWLKRMRENAESASREAATNTDSAISGRDPARFTERARNASHYLEVLNRILKQVA